MRKFNKLNFSDLSKASRAKLRTVSVLDFLGGVLTEDYKRHPIKALLPLTMIPGTGYGIAAATIAYKSLSKNFRKQLSDAFKKLVNLAFYESVLKKCPNTGEVFAPLIPLVRRQSKSIWRSSFYVAECNLNKLRRNRLTNALSWACQSLSRYPLPVRREGDNLPVPQFKITLDGVSQEDIADHLSLEDRARLMTQNAGQESPVLRL